VTKKEKAQLQEIWAKIENIVTIIDPHLTFKTFYNEKYAQDDILFVINDWLDFLRIAVKYKLFDNESLTRERDDFIKMLMDKKGK